MIKDAFYNYKVTFHYSAVFALGNKSLCIIEIVSLQSFCQEVSIRDDADGK